MGLGVTVTYARSVGFVYLIISLSSKYSLFGDLTLLNQISSKQKLNPGEEWHKSSKDSMHKTEPFSDAESNC